MCQYCHANQNHAQFPAFDPQATVYIELAHAVMGSAMHTGFAFLYAVPLMGLRKYCK